MIRVVMLGRLGNNLFQYATGRVLAEKHGVPLVMDASWFNADGWNQVRCLRRLPILASVVRRFSPVTRGLRKFTGKHYWELTGKPVYKEPVGDQRFDSRVFSMPGDCVLMGYFQSPRFFCSLQTLLRRELDTDGLDWPGEVRERAAELRGTPSVAVHVRRTDFLLHAAFKGVCGEDYYAAAMARMRGRVPGARFHVFSDDPDWCRRHFTGGDVTVADVAGTREDPLVDLHLMKQAAHHIIANSSYSWWAAWLGKKAGQWVLCPPRWYSDDSITAPIAEKLCDGWETVEA